MRIPVPWVFLLLYLVGVALQVLYPIAIGPPAVHHAAAAVGIALWVLGGVLAIWSLTLFRIVGTTTVPFGDSSRLVTSGPYRVSRNPMYVSLTLIYLGEAAFLSQAWPVLLLPLALIYAERVVVPYEESHLRQKFGGEYEAYAARVRRWL